MHKVFGVKCDASYIDRNGAYLIPFHNGKLGVVQTSKGFFFLGGGIDENNNETDTECIQRECLEEAGCTVVVKEFICSAEAYANMSTKFGKYCVVLSGRELESKISFFCNNYGYDYIFDKIEYCDQNRIDRIEAFKKSAKERFLYKNSDLSYQREYRLAIGIEIPEDHFIRLGPFTSANYIEAEKLKDLYFVVNCKCQ